MSPKTKGQTNFPKQCKDLLAELTGKVEKHNQAFRSANPACQNCVGKYAMNQWRGSGIYCANCKKLRGKINFKKSTPEEVEQYPDFCESEFDHAVVSVQEVEIHTLILDRIKAYKENCERNMSKSTVLMPDVGTYPQEDVIILSNPLIREVYKRLKAEYAKCGIVLMCVYAKPKVLKVKFAY